MIAAIPVPTAVGVAAVLAVLGVFALVAVRTRRPVDTDTFLAARSSAAPTALALSFVASGLGAWILFAPPEVGQATGVLGVLGYAVGGAVPFLAYAWLGPRIRAAAPEGTTLLDWVGIRFDASTRVLVAAVSVFYMFMFVTAELTAIGGVLDLLAGIDPWFSISAVAVVTAGYTAYGGLPVSLRTDRVQAVAVALLLAVVAVAVAVDVPDLLETARLGGLDDLTRPGLESFVVLTIAITAANLFHQGYWQRTWAARDGRVLARAGRLGAALTFVLLVGVGATGLVAAGLAVRTGSEPSPIPFFSLLFAQPDVVIVAVVVLAVALVASSLDTLQSGLTAVLSGLREGRSADIEWARLWTVLLTVPAALIALRGYDVLRLFLIADLAAAAAVVPVFLGLRPRVTAAAVRWGCGAGILAVIVYGTVDGGSLRAGIERLTLPDGLDLGAFVWAPLAAGAVTVLVGQSRAAAASSTSQTT